jgi:hypothetical protein
MEVEYYDTAVLTKWTLEDKTIREWVEKHLYGRVLNACCGKCKLEHRDVVRNDLNDDIDTDISVDVAELPQHFGESSFDTVFFDPPWSLYQSNLRYDGEMVHSTGSNYTSEIDTSSHPIEYDSDKSQIGHARMAKDGFDYLLREGGKVIQLSYNATCMPNRLGYERDVRAIFDPIGENKSVIGSIDVKL